MIIPNQRLGENLRTVEERYIDNLKKMDSINKANDKQINNDQEAEEWKVIPGWEGYYEASNIGNIRSIKRYLEVPHPHNGMLYIRPYGGKLLSPKTGDGGYLYVNLWRDNQGHMRAVHRLVCGAFTGYIPENLVCNHIDSVRSNNNISNLEFVTQKENLSHARAIGSR